MAIKILILSKTAWDNNNSFGSSFSNIFGGINDIEIANIYCSEGQPNNDIVSRSFQMSEKILLKNLLNRTNKPGKEIFASADTSNATCFNKKEQSIFNYFSKNRFIIYFWLRELIWKFSRWKSSELMSFIDDFEPDLIFLPVYYSFYTNRIGLFLKQYSNKKMLGYISDDNYTLLQFSLSPMFWLDRFIKRIVIKKVVNQLEILYVISSIQKRDYDKAFKTNCKILYKGGKFDYVREGKYSLNNPLRVTYTGNIGGGRWRTLLKIGDALDKVNDSVIKAELHIYTATPLSTKMDIAFKRCRSIVFHGKVPFQDIIHIHNKSDVLVHVESFELKERLLTRQSFSTKIVDYFERRKCIFAAGWRESASIKMLQDIAVVATSSKEIIEKIEYLMDNRDVISEYAAKSYMFGKKYHDKAKIQSELLSDIKRTFKQDK